MTKPTKIEKSLSESFGVDTVLDVTPRGESSEIMQINMPESKDLDSDAESVRNTLYDLLKAGTEAFDDLKRIAVSEESPRSFEVLNAMLGNLSDIAVKLIDVQDKVNKIKRASQKDSAPVNNGTVNNNTIFVGTTSDLQDMLKNLDMENDSE